MGDSLGRDATVDQPVSDFIFSLLGWSESLNHLFRCPMIREIWGRWVGTISILVFHLCIVELSDHNCTYTSIK
jgi:hypothetical protein